MHNVETEVTKPAFTSLSDYKYCTVYKFACMSTKYSCSIQGENLSEKFEISKISIGSILFEFVQNLLH